MKKYENRYLVDILAVALICIMFGLAFYYAPAFN